MNKKGYITLIEILVVVVVIGLLAAIMVPSMQKAREKQKRVESGVTYAGQSVEIYIDGKRVESSRVKVEITTK